MRYHHSKPPKRPVESKSNEPRKLSWRERIGDPPMLVVFSVWGAFFILFWVGAVALVCKCLEFAMGK